MFPSAYKRISLRQPQTLTHRQSVHLFVESTSDSGRWCFFTSSAHSLYPIQTPMTSIQTQLEPLDVPTAILQRRAIKSFKSDPIDPALLQRLINLTVAAPSSFNLQPWRIVLVQDAAQKQALAEAAWGQAQIIQAPVTFVFTIDSEGWRNRAPIYEKALQNGAWTQQTVDYFDKAIPPFQEGLGDRNREYAIKDAMIAATHLMLAAESLGLSSCPMNGWLEDKVKAVIGAADQPNVAIALLVPVGHAAEPRKDPGRLDLSSTVFAERLGRPYSA
jgi:nitroreductase